MNDSCLPHRMALTEHQLLGTPLPEDLRRHVEGCADCAREVIETDSVVRTLRHADPAPVDTSRTPESIGRPPSELRDRILRELGDARTPRRRWLPRAAVGVAAAVLTAAAVVIPMSLSGGHALAPSTTVALTRHGQMIEKPWGTEVPVVLSGLRNGHTYRVMAVNADGKEAPGGSLRGEGGPPVRFRMATAMPRDTITALIVEDEHGRVLTRLPVRPTAT